MKNINSAESIIIKHKLIDKYGEPNEDAICEIALETFCDIVDSIRQNHYSAEQIKKLMGDCEQFGDCSVLSTFLLGYSTGRSIQKDIYWAVIHNELIFCVYRYYLGEMVKCLHQILQNTETMGVAVYE